MLIVIGCERSGIMRQAFSRLGHLAFSVDLAPDEQGSPRHIVSDIIDYLNRYDDGMIDLLGLHPECTRLCVSGNHVYAAGKPKHDLRLAQVAWVDSLWSLAIRKAKRVYLENPVGVLTSLSQVLPKPQYIQPHDFGENASKKTALYLHNLPELEGTRREPGRLVEWPKGSGKLVERWENQTDSGQNRLAPSAHRWMDRSRTYQGVANAKAEQWGLICEKDDSEL
jgi:hypothetical protein